MELPAAPGGARALGNKAFPLTQTRTLTPASECGSSSHSDMAPGGGSTTSKSHSNTLLCAPARSTQVRNEPSNRATAASNSDALRSAAAQCVPVRCAPSSRQQQQRAIAQHVSRHGRASCELPAVPGKLRRGGTFCAHTVERCSSSAATADLPLAAAARRRQRRRGGARRRRRQLGGGAVRCGRAGIGGVGGVGGDGGGRQLLAAAARGRLPRATATAAAAAAARCAPRQSCECSDRDRAVNAARWWRRNGAEHESYEIASSQCQTRSNLSVHSFIHLFDVLPKAKSFTYATNNL